MNTGSSTPGGSAQGSLSALHVAHNQFTVQSEHPQRQLLAWRERVGHVIDVLPSRQQLDQPFSGSLSSYRLGDLMFTECRSDVLTMERSLARISTDNIRNFAFHLFLKGSVSVTTGGGDESGRRRGGASILVLDMDQPVRMQRDTSHLLTLFAPRSLVDALLPDAAAIHGRVFDEATADTRLLIDHMAALNRQLPLMQPQEALHAMQTALQLLMAAFGKQAGLQGNARAAVRSAMFGQARRYIQQHVHQAALSPEQIVNALRLPRRSLARLFEHEGGLQAYIRSSKLRAAADDLVKFPRLSVLEVAYGLGFKSASHFTRAFRRSYDMTPQDFRLQALQSRALAKQK